MVERRRGDGSAGRDCSGDMTVRERAFIGWAIIVPVLAVVVIAIWLA